MRLPLVAARELAAELVQLLEPACERIAIAGSVRRGCADVGDIELVAIARRRATLDLFGGAAGDGINVLDERCDELLSAATFAHRLDRNGRRAYGERYKRLSYRGVAVDLFATQAATWGLILAIRTGPSAFSHRLVTPRRQGGLLPHQFRVADGLRLIDGDELVPTPTEEDVFRLVGLPWIRPEDRA